MEEKEKKLDDQIDSLIISQRKVFLSDAVDQNSAKDVIRKLWYLSAQDPTSPILFIINSPGGSVDSGFAIWDQVKMMDCPIVTLVTGLAASMGSVLSLCASKGKRLATPNSRIMIHQPLIGGVIKGQATDLDIQAKEILKTRAAIVNLYADATGKDPKFIDKVIDRDTWMSAEEAKEFGLLDQVVSTSKDLKSALSM